MSRGYTWTLNNPTEADVEAIRNLARTYSLSPLCSCDVAEHAEREDSAPDDICFLMYGEERAPTTGTRHFQGYLLCKNRRRLRFINSLEALQRAHIEPSRGTPAHNIKYCSKDAGDAWPRTFVDPRDTGVSTRHLVHAFGTPPRPGKRTDLESFTQALQDGQSMREAALASPPTFVRYHRGLREFQMLIETPVSRPDKDVRFYYGPTGTGKTSAALTEFPDAYVWAPPTNGNAYAYGYEGQTVVIIDEFTGWLPWTRLLTMLHEHPTKVNTSGAYRNFFPQTVILTSNSYPHQWYPNLMERGLNLAPLIRRIKETRLYLGVNTPYQLLTGPQLSDRCRPAAQSSIFNAV